MPFSWGRAAGGWHRARCWAGVALASGLAYLTLSATPGGAEPRVSYGGPPGQTTLMIVGFAVTFGAWAAEAAAGRFRTTRLMDYGLLVSLLTGLALAARQRP